MPDFPWPPPLPSAWEQIPTNLLLAGLGTAPTLKVVEQRLSNALDGAGYYQRGYFGAPGGFALITQMERFLPDGAPVADRRWTMPIAKSTFSLEAYVKELLFTDPGHFRIVVLIVTTKAIQPSDKPMSASGMFELAGSGAMSLGTAIGDLPFTDKHSCMALIYEFARVGSDAQVVRPGTLLGRVHLERARIWTWLSSAQGK
jgi:hypothetical protein